MGRGYGSGDSALRRADTRAQVTGLFSGWPFVVTASNEQTVRLWDETTGAEIRRFEGHGSMVTSVAFSADGRTVLTGSWDHTSRLWDAATGSEIRRFGGHHDLVTSAAFSTDGRFVLTGSVDGTTRLWDPATGALLATLVSLTERGWGVIDPEGRYDASDPDNSPGLHFVVGNDVIELGQLKQRFYTPGLLARIWRGEKLPAIAGSLKEVHLVPEIKIDNPPAGSMLATVRLTNRGGQSHR